MTKNVTCMMHEYQEWSIVDSYVLIGLRHGTVTVLHAVEQ